MFSTAHGRPSVTLAHLEVYVIDVFEGKRPRLNVHALKVEADSSVDVHAMA